MVPALGIAYIFCITALLLKMDKNHWTTKTHSSCFLLPFLSAPWVPQRPGDGLATSTIACCLRQGHLQLQSRSLMFWLNIFIPRVLWGCRLSQMATRATVITEGVSIWLLRSVLNTKLLVYLTLYLSMASPSFPHLPQDLGTQTVGDSQAAKGRMVEAELLHWTKLVIPMAEL